MRRDGEWWLEGRAVGTADDTPEPPQPSPRWWIALQAVRAVAGLVAGVAFFAHRSHPAAVWGIPAAVVAVTSAVDLAARLWRRWHRRDA